MAEQPARSPDMNEVQVPTSVPAFGESGTFHPMAGYPLVQRRPRVVVRADLIPALGVLAGVALIGVPAGWLWSVLAPAEQVRVVTGGRLIPLAGASYHRFDDLAVFLLVGFGAGLLVGVATWLLRMRRGPVVLLATVVGSLLGAWLAVRVGQTFAGWHYPISAGQQVGATLLRGPRLESMWALVAQPLAAALAYGTASAWNGMDDLDRPTL